MKDVENKEEDRDETTEEETGDEGSFDEDEQELFEKLMKKVMDAGALKEELSNDLSTFTERVENVVDSIDRIENIEKSRMERTLFSSVEETETEGATSSGADGGTGGTLPEVGMEHIRIPSPTPYGEVADGTFNPDDEAELVSNYANEAWSILKNLKKLIEIKIQKGALEEAVNLYQLAVSIGGEMEAFKDEFSEIDGILDITEEGIPLPEEGNVEEEKEGETRVLDPELAEDINIIENNARRAIDQLNSFLEGSELSKEKFNMIKDLFLEANELFREKRFNKAHQIALKGLEAVKNEAQDVLENRLQDNLYRAKELIEEVQKKGKLKDDGVLKDLKEDLDEAMKAYLVNEYEKANLLSRKVLNTILDIKEPESGNLKDQLKAVRAELEGLKEKNILHSELADILEMVDSVESLIRKRDHAGAERLMRNLSISFDELKKRMDTFDRAKEMEIRISNRLKVLEGQGNDIAAHSNKLKFLKRYLEEGRFEDVIVIGTDLEDELNSMKHVREEMEARKLYNEIESFMEHVDELEDHEVYRNLFASFKEAFSAGDLERVLKEGTALRDELRIRIKSIVAERAKRISSSMIESRMLLLKMRSLNLDTTGIERRIRKARNLIKEGSTQEGLRQMDKIIHEMRSKVKEHIEHLKALTSIHRDSLEVVLDRHRDLPVVFHIKNKMVPLLRKMEELGRYREAIDRYLRLNDKFKGIQLPEERRGWIETDLTESKFEIYKRKERGLDISEPLTLYSRAQKLLSKGEVVAAEHLVEISRRYCQELLPLKS